MTALSTSEKKRREAILKRTDNALNLLESILKEKFPNAVAHVWYEMFILSLTEKLEQQIKTRKGG